jgi:hypothetical protein
MQNSQNASKHPLFHGPQIRIILLRSLLLLDGFTLGGCVVLLLVRNLLLEKCCSTEPMVGAVYNLLDDMIPYHLFFGGALMVCAGLSVLAWKTANLPAPGAA